MLAEWDVVFMHKQPHETIRTGIGPRTEIHLVGAHFQPSNPYEKWPKPISTISNEGEAVQRPLDPTVTSLIPYAKIPATHRSSHQLSLTDSLSQLIDN
jgi:hypothetical protein